MKYLPCIAGGLLGALFLMTSLMFFFNMMPDQPPPPEGSPAAHFMAAFGPTGYMKFIKVFEFLGAILVAIPKTRNFGLLVLGPIIVNILAYHVFIMNGAGIFEKPFMLPIICVLALYLLWVGRKQFAGLAGSRCP
jgi:putative oxidoreductase